MLQGTDKFAEAVVNIIVNVGLVALVLLFIYAWLNRYKKPKEDKDKEED